MSRIQNALFMLNSMSGSKLIEYMSSNFGLEEDRTMYLITNLVSLLDNSKIEDYERLFVQAYKQDKLDKLYKKYFNIDPINKLHMRKQDTESFLNSELFLDNMEELYDKLSDGVSIEPEEFVFCYSILVTSALSEPFLKKVLES